MNTQQAPFPVQSSLESPTKLASKTNQFNRGGMDFIIIKQMKDLQETI